MSIISSAVSSLKVCAHVSKFHIRMVLSRELETSSGSLGCTRSLVISAVWPVINKRTLKKSAIVKRRWYSGEHSCLPSS